MKRVILFMTLLVFLAALMACAVPTPTPAPTAKPPAATQPPAVVPTQPPAVATKAPAKEFKVVVIGKSVHPYWSNVEKGVRAAAKDLGLRDDQAIFFVPPKEDVAAQSQTMETYIAQGVTGIAIAPSDPNALEPVMKKASTAGLIVTTLDTPPIKGSVSLVYIGTDNLSAGKAAGAQMVKLLPNGGKVGIGRGSDTALNALQRTDGFKEAIKGTKITALEPVNDKEDAAQALSLANSVISANPDLAGAFGVYAYNGPAWATAIKEAKKVGVIKLVSFDATTDIINGIKEGVIDATVAQREFDQGYKSVQLINKIFKDGKDKAFADMGVKDGIIDTGVDVVTAATLKDYEAGLDKKGIPHEWNTKGWEPKAALKVAFVTDIGGIDDKSFNQTAWAGVEMAQKELGVQGKYLQSRQQTDYDKNITTFVQEGYPLIITVGYLLGPATAKGAIDNPKVNFAIVDYTYPDCWPGAKVGTDCGSDKAIPNARGLAFQTDEAAFLAGYLAAGMSKTGKVGTFGGLQIPTVTIFMKGFQAGVEYYNAQKKASVKLLGWDTKADKGLFTGTFTDPDKGRTAAKSLIDEGADIIQPVAGLTGNGAFTAAKTAGNVLCIGVDTDQYISVPDAAPVLLTSVVKNMHVAVFETIKSLLDGKFQGGTNYVGTLKNDGVGLAPFHDLDKKIPDALKNELNQVKTDLIAGKIKTGVEALK